MKLRKITLPPELSATAVAVMNLGDNPGEKDNQII